MTLPPTPDEAGVRALLLLLLLAREADLPLTQVDSVQARATVQRGLVRRPARHHGSAVGGHGGRPWMCRHRWSHA